MKDDPKMIGMIVIAGIFSIGVIILTAISKLDPVVFIALASAVFGALYERTIVITEVVRLKSQISERDAVIKKLGG